ncbi:MAG: M56 family metallopeptidase [Planctomycetota bacterium]
MIPGSSLHLFAQIQAQLWAQLWQVTLLALLVGIIVRFFAGNRPHLAHALWLVVLIKCVTPPVWASPASPFSWIQLQQSSHLTRVQDTGLRQTVEEDNANRNPDDTIVVNFDFDLNEEAGDAGAISPADRPPMTRQSDAIPISWYVLLRALWLGGAIVGLIYTLWRLAIFLRWTRRCRIVPCENVDNAAARLSRRLGLRRQVGVRVLDRPVGPVVVGIFKPTILLPHSIVRNASAEKLEMLLAHELIHVRRGDLWWAMLQTIAGCLFWFHPLVRIAVQMVTRESERSCDEETVASLGCTPASYARGLLDVLEQKQRLRVAPALPGVRPVDITSARLERVMKLGHGSHKRTPLWVWMVMVVCGAITLPGAALVLGQEGEPLPSLQPDGSTRLAESPDGANESWRLESYEISDLLEIAEGLTANGIQPEERMLRMLPCKHPGENGESSTPDGKFVQFVAGSSVVVLGGSEPTMKILGGSLYAYADEEGHEIVEGVIEATQQHGFQQIVVEMRFISGDSEVWDDYDWTSTDVVGNPGPVSAVSTVGLVTASDEVPFEAGDYLDPVVRHAAFQTELRAGENLQGYSTFPDIDQVTRIAEVEIEDGAPMRATQYQLPMRYSVVSDEEMRGMFTRIQADARTNICQAPTVTMLNGQQAVVQDSVSRPFVIGLETIANEDETAFANQPKIGLVEEGVVTRINPVIQADGSIQLNGQIMLPQITEVDTFTFEDERQIDENGDPVQLTIQLPIVAVYGLSASVNIRDGETLLLSAEIPPSTIDERPGDQPQPEAVLIAMRCVLLDMFPAEDPEGSTSFAAPEYELEQSGAQQVYPQPDGTYRTSESDVVGLYAPEFVPAAVEPVDTTTEIIIRSRRSEAAEVTDSFVCSIEELDLDIRIETDVELKTSADRIQVRGEDLEVRSEDGEFLIRGDQGEMEITGSETLVMRFSGNVFHRLDADMEIFCDKFMQTIRESDPYFQIHLQGNASIHSNEYVMQAREIVLEDEFVLLTGEAVVHQKLDDGTVTSVSGDKIRFDPCEEFLMVDGVGTAVSEEGEFRDDLPFLELSDPQVLPAAYYLKDEIQYFPEGPEFKLVTEAAALREQRESQLQQQGTNSSNLDNGTMIIGGVEYRQVGDGIWSPVR